MAGTFQEMFESTLNFHAPINKKKARAEFAPLLTPKLRKNMMTRDRLQRMLTEIPELWTAYARKSNHVTKKLERLYKIIIKFLLRKIKGIQKNVEDN